MRRPRCCLTPLVFNEDGRVTCLACGHVYRDPITFADRASDTLVAVLSATTDPEPPSTRPAIVAAITARVLAYVKANPSTHEPVRRGRPPKGAVR